MLFKHWLVALFLFMFAPPVLADFSDNLRFAIDSSFRLNINDITSVTSRNYFLGMDTHKVFNDGNRDIGYAVAQLYYTKLSDQTPYPFMFSNKNDEQLIIREAHYNILTSRKSLLPNIRLGHFTLPFGLEDSQDTNGRLLDYGHGKNLGTKLDWGILANKVHTNVEYKVSYSLGGKDDPKSKEGSSVLTARVSTLSHLDFGIGLSLYKAKLDQKNRKRVAFDVKYYLYNWGLKSEIAYGKVDDNSGLYWLFELNRRTVNEQWKVYCHYIFDDQHQQKQSEQTFIAGARYTPNNNLDVSVQLNHQLQHPANKKELRLMQMQLRHRF